MKLVNFNEHDLADYLRKFGDWHYKPIVKRHNTAFTEFYSPNDEVIALVIYDNQKCDCWVYIPEKHMTKVPL